MSRYRAPTLMKMMLLLILYNVRSKRKLMTTIPLRLDWIWFPGYDPDTKIPNHSVLCKTRKRRGEETFRAVFEKVVIQAVNSGFIHTRLSKERERSEPDSSQPSKCVKYFPSELNLAFYSTLSLLFSSP
ncbi:MAG: transposase [Acidobacteria bacterium]|nr:transposase [Acidobacteriota bacterium]